MRKVQAGGPEGFLWLGGAAAGQLRGRGHRAARVCSAESNVSPRYQNLFINKDTQTSEGQRWGSWCGRGGQSANTPPCSCSHWPPCFPSVNQPKGPVHNVTHRHNHHVCRSVLHSRNIWWNIPGSEGQGRYKAVRGGTAARRRRFRFQTPNSVAINHKYYILQKHFIPHRPNPDYSCCPPQLGAMQGTLRIVCSGHTLPRVRRQPVSKR